MESVISDTPVIRYELQREEYIKQLDRLGGRLIAPFAYYLGEPTDDGRDLELMLSEFVNWVGVLGIAQYSLIKGKPMVALARQDLHLDEENQIEKALFHTYANSGRPSRDIAQYLRDEVVQLELDQEAPPRGLTRGYEFLYVEEGELWQARLNTNLEGDLIKKGKLVLNSDRPKFVRNDGDILMLDGDKYKPGLIGKSR